jgi:hypothetical protein
MVRLHRSLLVARPLFVLCLVLGVGFGCTKKPVHQVKGCAPFVTDQCLTPFPNAWFEEAASTETGHRLVLPQEALPTESNGALIDPHFLGQLDGYSAATMLLAYFPEGVDAKQLTPSPSSTIDERIAHLSAEGQPIVLVDVAARKRIPLFAELDINAVPANGDRQALIIHPAVRLAFGTRYAVAITRGLHDSSGAPLAPKGEFATWAAGKLTAADRLFEISDRLDEDVAAFEALGIHKADLALAWDFDTASETSTTGQLKSMLDRTRASGPDGFGYTITSAKDHTASQDPNQARRFSGTFQVPSFESGPEPSPLAIDEKGDAIMGGLADWHFAAIISQCAAASTGPAPLIVAGPGLFSDGEEAVDSVASRTQDFCGVVVSADFLGLSHADLGVLTKVLADPNQFPLVTSRLEQAHVNYQMLARLALRKFSSDPAFTINGHPTLTTASPVYYWGESNGGIQGSTFMALTDLATRGVLIVPGGIWTELMWRSGDFDLMLTALQNVVPDRLDLQLLLALTQSLWDKTDPVNFLPLLVGTEKRVLFQESVGDPVVTNVATRTEMRTIGAKALGPLVQSVYGVTPESGPLTGLVYTQWSIDAMPMPPYADIPGPSSNGAHQAIGGIPQAVDQAVEFMKSGVVVDKCDAMPCVFRR